MATNSTKSYPIWVDLQITNVEGLNWLIDFVIPQLPFTFHLPVQGNLLLNSKRLYRVTIKSDSWIR